MKKIRKGQICMTLGLLLTAAALFITVYNIYDGVRAERAAGAVMDMLAKSVPEERLKIYERFPWIDMPEKEIDGNMYLGYVELPERGISLPVMSRWSYKGLKTAPCRYKGTVYNGNMIICGHNYNSHFGQLKDVKTGENVRFTDMWGNEFDYTVRSIETIPANKADIMEAGNWDLTLFTCTISGRQRITVRCEAVPPARGQQR